MHESFQSSSELHLVLEMCQGGELYALLVKKIKEEQSSKLLAKSWSYVTYGHVYDIYLWALKNQKGSKTAQLAIG